MARFLILLLLILSASCPAIGQLRHTTSYSAIDEKMYLCSRTIILDSLGYFFKEHGCEGRSFILCGRYHINDKGLVRLTPFSVDSLPAFKSIRRSKNGADSLITLTFYDRFGDRLSHMYGIGKVTLDGKMEGETWTDEQGQIILDRRKYRDLVVSSIISIYGQQPALVTGDENKIEVHFALPGLFLMGQEITIDKPFDQKLLLKTKGLFTEDGKKLLYPIDL